MTHNASVQSSTLFNGHAFFDAANEILSLWALVKHDHTDTRRYPTSLDHEKDGSRSDLHVSGSYI